jgi:hypothetical protein
MRVARMLDWIRKTTRQTIVAFREAKSLAILIAVVLCAMCFMHRMVTMLRDRTSKLVLR